MPIIGCLIIVIQRQTCLFTISYLKVVLALTIKYRLGELHCENVHFCASREVEFLTLSHSSWQRRQSGLKSGGSWTRVKKFRFSRKISEKFIFFQAISQTKDRFFKANFRNISFFSGNLKKIQFFK